MAAYSGVRALAEQIRQRRTASATTVENLARQTGLGAARIESIEQAATDVTLLEVTRIAAVLKVPVHELFK